MLSERRIRFVHEYCVDWNATQAAIRAGYSENGAGQKGHDLLKVIEIQELIEERKDEIAQAALVTPAWVLKQWRMIASADPAELTQIRVTCCRHCWGAEHWYQWTEVEYSRAVDIAIEMGKPPPEGIGGFGWDMNRDPHPGCPECGGNGIEQTFMADTRKLSASAKRLFAGVQRTKDGIKVLTRDQDEALKNLSSYLGMSKEQLNLVHLQAKSLEDFYKSADPKPLP